MFHAFVSFSILIRPFYLLDYHNSQSFSKRLYYTWNLSPVVYPCTVCLTHLLVAGDLIETAVFTESGTRLLEVEGDISLDALLTDIQHPFIVADTGIASRLAADSHLLTPGAQTAVEVNGF